MGTEVNSLRKAIEPLRARIRHRRVLRSVTRDWRRRFEKVYSLHPEYKKHCHAELESRHVSIWERYGTRVYLDTLRVSAAISGRTDPRIVPEEIFAGFIERCLNPLEWSAALSHKSLYGRLFNKDIFPRSYLHNVNGQLLDGDLEPISADCISDVIKRLPFPAVIKPNTGSSGGKGVAFVSNEAALSVEVGSRCNYIVQEHIEQDAFFAQFNSLGLNTLRVYTYRPGNRRASVVLNVALRLGKGGSLDNETAGGIVCFVNGDGRLNGFAVDKYGGKFLQHPDTGVSFGDKTIPKYTQLLQSVVELADQMAIFRLCGWDMSLDTEGNWRCLEVNLRGHTIRFTQYAGHPFFGEWTDEVVEETLRHPMRGRAELAVY